MLYILSMLTVLIVVALIEIPQLKKINKKRDWIVFSIFYSLACVLSLMSSAGIQLTSPLQWIVAIYKPIIGIFLY